MPKGNNSFTDLLTDQTRGSEWIEQRMEWIEQRMEWIEQRMEWIEQWIEQVNNQSPISSFAEPPQNAEKKVYKGMSYQTETDPIPKEELINEVRGIYARLVMVEKKCIQIDQQHNESKAELSSAQWQALVDAHRKLVNLHHDFFLVSQHRSASLGLKQLPEKYAMLGRMWRYGIHHFLEILRQRLPESRDYMLDFLYLAYSVMTLMLENAPAFQDTWAECLGDLARYRMAVENSESHREDWVAASRGWYNQVEDRNPDIGRIQHHLAVLACPDALQQLFYYTKALACVRPFPNARESMALLLNRYSTHQESMVLAFLATHEVLFTQGPRERFITRANDFMSHFRREISGLGLGGVYIMSVNFASVLQYGEPERAISLGFSGWQSKTFAAAHAFALKWYSAAATGSLTDDQLANGNDENIDVALQIASLVDLRASCLAFHTIAILLEQMGDFNAYPGIHISMAFVWCLALHPPAMQQVELLVPWLELTRFLNTLLTDTNLTIVGDQTFPASQLPEDYLIRGQVWSQHYYPEKFFDGVPSEGARPVIEEQKTITLRRYRCLWLGARIAALKRWMIYNSTGNFEATEIAHNFAQTAKTCDVFNSTALSTGSRSSATCRQTFGA